MCVMCYIVQVFKCLFVVLTLSISDLYQMFVFYMYVFSHLVVIFVHTCIVYVLDALVTKFDKLTPTPRSLESFEYYLENESCLEILYYGDAAFGIVKLVYGDSDNGEMEHKFNMVPGAFSRHLLVSPLLSFKTTFS